MEGEGRTWNLKKIWGRLEIVWERTFSSKEESDKESGGTDRKVAEQPVIDQNLVKGSGSAGGAN